MRCPNCNDEHYEPESKCSQCGYTPENESSDSPTIGLGMVIFIILGTIALLVYGTFYYLEHQHDPAYTQTAIEPDSNLANKAILQFDTLKVNRVLKDSSEIIEEEVQAEKVFNSIRKNTKRSNQPQKLTDDTETFQSTVVTDDEAKTKSESQTTTAPVQPKTEPID